MFDSGGTRMRCLVTGSAGFIGSHIVDALVDLDMTVFGLDDMSGGYAENINPHCIHDNVDLRNKKRAQEAIERIAPHVVYHLAANAAENKAQFSPRDITERNINIFLNTLVPAIRGGCLKRFVFVSSIAVYGASQTPFTEDMTPRPEDIYGISKYACEEMLKVLAKVHNFDYVIVRPHNVYGPRQNMADPFRNVVTIFMNNILNNHESVIFGDGMQLRGFTYIDDIVGPIVGCGLNDDIAGQIFNLGTDKKTTIKDLYRAIQHVTGSTMDAVHIEDRPQEVKVAISNHDKENLLLGYDESVTLEQGLARTWAYCKEKGPMTPVKSEIEIQSPKMPSSWGSYAL